MFGAITFIHHVSGVHTGSEIVWWVEPAVRGGTVARELHDAGLGWCKAQGATEMQMESWNSRLDVVYRRMGYTETERIFTRAL